VSVDKIVNYYVLKCRKFVYQIGYHYQQIFVIEYWISVLLVKFHIHATIFSSTVHGIYSSMTTVIGATLVLFPDPQ